MSGSTQVKPSWPETYESLFSMMWTEVTDSPVTWRSLIDEADEMRDDLVRKLEAGEAPPPGADEAMRELAIEYGESLISGRLLEAFHPRIWAVFQALPSAKALAELFGEFYTRSAEEGQGGQAFGSDAERVDMVETTGYLELTRLHAIFQWMHYGRRVYALGRHTAELLARTDLPGMPFDEVSFPFRSFYLRLPDGMYHYAWKGGESRIGLEGLLVTVDHTAAGDPLPRAIRLIMCPNRMIESGLAMPQVSVVARPGMTVRDVAAEMEAELSNGKSAELFQIDTDRDPAGNIALGFALYLMSEHPHLEPVPAPYSQPNVRPGGFSFKTSKKEKKPKKRTTSRLGFVKVGRETAPVQTGTSGAGRSLERLVWVRGHWRQQAHGAGRALRRTIWIEPFTKGPDMAEMVGATGGRVQDARERL